MGVFRKTRISKQVKKTDYWYMKYNNNGKEVWKSASKVDEITKTVAPISEFLPISAFIPI
jgi:hypothetical protein